MAAATNAGIPIRGRDWRVANYNLEVVVQAVREKYAEGKLVIDPTRSEEEIKSFVYVAAHNAAIDWYFRRHKRYVGMPDEDASRLSDKRHSRQSDEEDAQIWVREGLCRLAKDCGQKQLEILARFVLAEEDREELAREYGIKPDSVSVIKNRWLPKLRSYTEMAMKEDLNGQMTTSPNRIQFLKPFLKWL